MDHFVSAPDDKQLAYVLNDKLVLVENSGKTTQLSANLPIFSVLTWYNKSKLLVITHTNNIRSLYLYNVTNQQSRLLTLKEKAWWVEDI
jgi:hypothetical protein